MTVTHNRLTARKVESVKGRGRTMRLADGGGLYLLVARGGSKSWLLRTVVSGKRCDIGLGGVATVSLADARAEAARLRRVARAGQDPLAVRRRERKTVPTLREAANSVHAAHSPAYRNAKHKAQWISSLEEVLKQLGGRQVNEVTSGDLLDVVSASWLTKPETSRRVVQRLKVIFDWCRVQGYCSGDNPAQGLTNVLPKHRGTRRHFKAMPYQKVGGFVHQLRDANTTDVVKLAFEFAILAAARTSEVLQAKRSEFDLDARTWTIPAERMKAHVEHRVPLSDRCVEILQVAFDRFGGSDYVFPGRKPKRPLSGMVFLMVRRRMNRTDFDPHGFRSSFRDWAEELTNFPRAVCEAALAHRVKDKAEAAYLRTDLFERRKELMAAWSAYATARPVDIAPTTA